MSDTKKVIVNACYGGYGLSDAAYERLIALGVPVRAYVNEPRDPETGLYTIRVESNEGEVIFDRDLATDHSEIDRGMRRLAGRYWDTWTDKAREHPLVLQVVEEMGKAASGNYANLHIVEIPADVEYTVEEYDGYEHIAEVHRTWR